MVTVPTILDFSIVIKKHQQQKQKPKKTNKQTKNFDEKLQTLTSYIFLKIIHNNLKFYNWCTLKEKKKKKEE